MDLLQLQPYFARRRENILSEFASNESALQAEYASIAQYLDDGGTESEIAEKLETLSREIARVKVKLSKKFTQQVDLKTTLIKLKRRVADAKEETTCLEKITRRVDKQMLKLQHDPIVFEKHVEAPKVVSLDNAHPNQLEKELNHNPLVRQQHRDDFLDKEISKHSLKLIKLETRIKNRVEPNHPVILEHLRAAFSTVYPDRDLESLNAKKLSRFDLNRIYVEFIKLIS